MKFEEWKELMRQQWKELAEKRREGMTHSEIHNHESQLGMMSKNDPEYGQTYTITYNVTGNVDTTGWPTEIKSARTLKLNIPIPYGATGTVDANTLFTYDNGVFTIEDVQQDIEIAINVTDVLYENAKPGDFLYSDWTFGPTQKTGYLGRCVGLATENEGKSVWCSPKSSSAMKWSTETVDTGLDNFTSSDTAKTDFNGKANTELLLSLGADKYLAAAYASEQFQGNGYLPAAGELYKYCTRIKTYVYSGTVWSSTEKSSSDAWYAYTTYGNVNVGYMKTSIGYYALGFLQLSGKPGKPINTNGHEYVDLGLPSGTKWATMNVGATSSTEYGDYYMYGMGSKTYDSADTPYDGTEDPLDLSKDTARQVYGGDWHMPTQAQMQELKDNTTYQWVTDYQGSGINGGTFTATNGAVLFFPAAGYWNGGSQSDVGSYGGYWGSYPDGIYSAYCFYIDGTGNGVYNDNREYGYSVRGVIS